MRYTCNIHLDNPTRKAHFETAGANEGILGGKVLKLRAEFN
jgi:hypothetical protein